MQKIVWYRTQKKYQIFNYLDEQNNSKFDMKVFLYLQIIKDFVTDNDKLYSQSHTLDFYNKDKLFILLPWPDFFILTLD